MSHYTKLQILQNTILEAIANGMLFPQVADMLCREAEELLEDSVCSILSVDELGKLATVAAPSLPKNYSRAIDTLYMGPAVGSCGTAAYYGRPVEVVDIETDPLWEPYKTLALDIGLKACWSSPILRSDGKVIATFAFYSRSKRGPTEIERAIVQTCVHLCKVSIAHGAMLRKNVELARFDQLTGLANRRRFEEIFEATLGTDAPFGLLIIDADQLKAVNDTRGHLVGDQLIVEISGRLAGLGAGLLPYRIGGDEFAVMIPGCQDHLTLRQSAERVIQAMADPFEADGSLIVPSVTVGGVVRHLDGTTDTQLRQNADLALYHAKENQRGSFVAFAPNLRTRIMRRAETIRMVSNALADGRVLNYYQPIVCISDARIIGLEALVRVRDETGAIITAGEFQDAFRDRRISREITRKVVTQVAGDMAAWLASGTAPDYVSINLSTADFTGEPLDGWLTEIFSEAGVPFGRIVFEVTESVLIDGPTSYIASAVASLRAKGFKIALDDFGTGFASLANLLTLPIDTIKIDKSFIAELRKCSVGDDIVEALTTIAGRIDIDVVAEGIEHQAQAERLIQFGCVRGQGFHFALPADASRTTDLLRHCGAKPTPANGIALATVGGSNDAHAMDREDQRRRA